MAKGKEAGQSRAKPKDKGKGKEVAPKSKEFESAKPQAMAQEKKKAANPLVPQPVSKEDPPPPKAWLRISLFFSFLFL